MLVTPSEAATVTTAVTDQSEAQTDSQPANETLVPSSSNQDPAAADQSEKSISCNDEMIPADADKEALLNSVYEDLQQARAELSQEKQLSVSLRDMLSTLSDTVRQLELDNKTLRAAVDQQQAATSATDTASQGQAEETGGARSKTTGKRSAAGGSNGKQKLEEKLAEKEEELSKLKSKTAECESTIKSIRLVVLMACTTLFCYQSLQVCQTSRCSPKCCHFLAMLYQLILDCIIHVYLILGYLFDGYFLSLPQICSGRLRIKTEG